jgi:glycerophosphoryl diester phosphodiesterase
MRAVDSRRRLGSGVPLWLGACALALGCANFALPAPEAPRVRVIGHRGCAGHAPENTLPAIAKALELGASEVEIDIQLSRDGELILFHDSKLGKKTALRGRVADHPAALLLTTDIGSWFDAEHPKARRRYAGTTLTTLPEVFRRFGRKLHYHIELKSAEPELARRIIELVRDHGLSDRVTLTSFFFDQVVRAHAIDSELPTTWLLDDASDETLARAAAAKFTGVAIDAAAISAERVARARALGLDARAWGIKSPELMERALEAGASGMTIDWPELLIERLARPAALAQH